jgi:hypothetical protein
MFPLLGILGILVSRRCWRILSAMTEADSPPDQSSPDSSASSELNLPVTMLSATSPSSMSAKQ